MRVTRIYYEGKIVTGESLSLPANASHHLVRVLRCKKDTDITVFNGEAGEYSATLLNDDPRAVNLIINSFTDISRESCLRITLVQGISRGEHMDTTVQKATELGVAEIIPVICMRSTNINTGRSGKKHDRWKQIIISACEQSGRNSLPRMHEITPLDDALANVDASTKLVLDPTAVNGINSLQPRDNAMCILSGPEGGLAREELNNVCNAGFVRVKFGPRILRTETAGPAFITALQAIWGDMGQ